MTGLGQSERQPTYEYRVVWRRERDRGPRRRVYQLAHNARRMAHFLVGSDRRARVEKQETTVAADKGIFGYYTPGFSRFGLLEGDVTVERREVGQWEAWPDWNAQPGGSYVGPADDEPTYAEDPLGGSWS